MLRIQRFRNRAAVFCLVLLPAILYYATKTVKTDATLHVRNQALGISNKRIVDPLAVFTDQLRYVYSERRHRLEWLCKSRETSGATPNILVYRNMSYCVVAKAGCTFWIRVFRFLHNDTSGRHLESPFQLTREEAHGLKKLKLYRLQNKTDREVVMETVRFLVARNPFSRLLSAYMDKLFLPGLWNTEGRNIVSSIRDTSNPRSLQCGHDVSFSEFLTFVVRVGKVDPALLNGHWRPIDHTCDPCTFKPHIIAKQETFSSDSEFILNLFGLGDMLRGYEHRNHVIDEISIITDSNYDRGADCMNRKELARRLWKTFQVNGYFLPGSERALDKESAETLTKDRLIGLMIQEYRSRPLSSFQTRQQRTAYLKKAYETVPQLVLLDIIRLYHNDFDFFGYERNSMEVYP